MNNISCHRRREKQRFTILDLRMFMAMFFVYDCLCGCVRMCVCACERTLFDISLLWKLPVSAALLYIMLLCLSHCLRTATRTLPIAADWVIMVSIETLWPIAVAQGSVRQPMIQVENPWTTEC